MSMMMKLALLGAKLVTKTFTSTQAWTAPDNVGRLQMVAGNGASGQDAYVKTTWTRTATATFTRRDGGPPLVTNAGTSTGDGEAPGTDYCDPVTYFTVDESPSYDSSQTCYHFSEKQTTVKASTGAAATAFSRTFPGSTGSVAPPTTSYTNVAIVPGTSYTISVPAGGSITISYYE